MKKNIISSDLLKEAQVEIRHISPYIDRTKLDEQPHRHPFQEIIFIISGRGKHTIDDEEINLTPNTIYVIGEGQVHEFLEGFNLKGYLLRYRESFLPSELSLFTSKYSLFQMISDSNALILSKDEAMTFKANFEELIAEKNGGVSLQGNQVFHFLLLTLLSRINRIIKTSSAKPLSSQLDRDEVMYRKFFIHLEEQYKSNHSISFYSDHLNTNARTLASVVTTKSGMTIKQHINRRLIIEAKRLLKYTNLSFKEISYELGYKEPAYFSRLFKIKMGMSPKEYRGLGKG